MRIVLVAGLVALILPASVRAEPPSAGANELPQYEVEDASAAVVTQENLLESERFWPYRVSLVEAFKPIGQEKALKIGDLGVLIRVESAGIARIDFARRGIHEVPVAKTDLIEQANRLRRGVALKKAPNFTLAVGPRLVSADTTGMAPFLFRRALAYRGFLTVFADPDAADFPKIAASLAPLRERQGVLTILLPVSKRPDLEIHDRLRSMQWPVAFVYDHLSESYLASLLPEGGKQPFVMLQTREGRVRFQSNWNPGVAQELRAVLDRDFPKGPIASPPETQDAAAPTSSAVSDEGQANPGANQSREDSKP